MLRERGHEVGVLAALAPRGLLGFRNRLTRLLSGKTCFPADHTLGYPVFRGWNPCAGVDELIGKWRPDAVVAQSGEVLAIAEAFLERGVPTCAFLRHAHYSVLGGRPDKASRVLYVANSEFTARCYRDDYGLDCAVFAPLVIPDLYRTETDRSRVVYVNPNPMKGIDLVLRLAAARPDVPFDVVESWTLPDSMVAGARACAARLKNVRWLRAREDMRRIYRHARLVLMPSGVGHPEWRESWGRVASEAQLSGIPVLASNSGGLPETVGPGGIVVDTEAPFEEWLSALSELLDNPGTYATCSAAAKRHSERRELSPEYQMDRFVKVLADLSSFRWGRTSATD
jgi:glycosyltransferase involved in cell wall biosynthesis